MPFCWSTTRFAVVVSSHLETVRPTVRIVVAWPRSVAVVVIVVVAVTPIAAIAGELSDLLLEVRDLLEEFRVGRHHTSVEAVRWLRRWRWRGVACWRRSLWGRNFTEDITERVFDMSEKRCICVMMGASDLLDAIVLGLGLQHKRFKLLPGRSIRRWFAFPVTNVIKVYSCF
mgnify:CR=1 FL=1